MTPEELAALRKRLGLPPLPEAQPVEQASEEPPAKAEAKPEEEVEPPPRRAPPKREPGFLERVESVRSNMGPAPYKPVEPPPALPKTEISPVPVPPAQVQAPAPMTVGDVLDLDPNEAPDPTTKAFIQRVQASPMTFEPGNVQARDVRMVPLQDAAGHFMMRPSSMEKTFTELLTMQYVKRNNLGPLNHMTPEQQAAAKAVAQEEARRRVASIVGSSERRQNYVMPVEPRKAVGSVMSGEAMPLPLLATPFGMAAFAASKRIQAGTEIPFVDQRLAALARPWIAESRPGFAAADVEGGPAVMGAAKEHPLWWGLRVNAISTPVYSWLFDPEATWEIGGDRGFGSQHHVERTMSEYDATQDMGWIPNPFTDPAGAAKQANTNALIGATLLLEPDVFSVATLGLGKAVEAIQIGRRVMQMGRESALASADLVEATGSIHAARGALKPGTSAERIFDHASETFQAELGGVAPRAARLTPRTLYGAEGAADAASKSLREAEAATATAAARVTAAHAGEGAADSEVLAKARIAAKGAVDELRDAEADLVSMAAMKSSTKELRGGDMVVDLVNGEKYRFAGFNYDGGKKLATVIDESGGTFNVPMGQITRAGHPGKVKDVMTVMRALQGEKREYNALTKAYREAIARGDFEFAKTLAEKLNGIRPKMFRGASDVALEGAKARYTAAAANALKLLRDVDAIASAGGVTEHLVAAQEALREALSVEKARRIEAEALAELPKKFAEHLRKVAGEFEKAQKMELGTTEMGRSVLDDVAVASEGKIRVSVNAYKDALVARYGQEALDRAMEGPKMQPLRSFLRHAGESGRNVVRTLNPAGLDALRDVERSVHAASEQLRLGEVAHAKSFADELANRSRWVTPHDVDSLVAFGYQASSWLSRMGDWISSSSVGLATVPIQQAVRRSVERLARLSHQVDLVATSAPPDKVVEHLTDWLHESQVLERAFNYLKIRAAGDGFVDDVVVRALTRATMPRGAVQDVAVRKIADELQKELLAETFTPSKMLEYLTSSKMEGGPTAAGTMVARTGGADSQANAFRFVVRGLAQAANLDEVVNDLVRIAGPQMTEDTRRLLNWWARPDVEHLTEAGVEAVDKLRRVIATYNLPMGSDMSLALTSWFRATEGQARIMKLGELEGRGLYIPGHVLDALNDVPHRLAKEMQEFNQPTALPLRAYDRLLRNWKMTAVNGWLLPRAAMGLTNFVGNWSQMVTSVGFIPATVIAAESATDWIPFVGPRLSKAMDLIADRSILPALFDRSIVKLMRGSANEQIRVLEGAITHKKLMEDAVLDGCWSSFRSDVLAEKLLGKEKTLLEQVSSPAHIHAFAEMMSEAESRMRLRLYYKARTGALSGGRPMARNEARKLMNDALYDWNTGVPEHEKWWLSRVAAFWTFRRGMMKQGLLTLTEGFGEPGTSAWAKALTGQTKLSRARKLGRAVITAPDIVDPTQPEDVLDDYAQLDLLGRTKAPWWAKAQTFIGGIKASPERKLWHSEVAGRDVTYEAMLFPVLTTMDQLILLHEITQTFLATGVMAAEAAGMKPTMTTTSGGEIAQRAIEEFTDMLVPFADEAVAGTLRALAEQSDPNYSDRGIPVPKAQAVVLRRILDASGSGHFMSAHEDNKGQLRMDRTMYGVLTSLILSFPQVADVARTWAYFDNPGMNESLAAGLTEALGMWTGAFRMSGHDPIGGVGYEVKAQEREFKEQRSALEKEVRPPRH